MLEKLLTFLESSNIPYAIDQREGLVNVQFIAGGDARYEIKFAYDDETDSMMVHGYGMPF